MSEPEPGTDAREGGWDRRRTVYLAVAGLVVAAVAAVLIIGMQHAQVDNRIQDALDRGERIAAPEFSLPVLVPGPGIGPKGASLRLADLRGRPVVLNTWASWCDTCIDEAPLMESVWQQYRGRGLVVLGVNVRDVDTDALAFQSKYGMTFPAVRDGTDRVWDAYGMSGVPETFVLDRQGRVAARLIGAVTSGENLNAFKRVLDTVIAERA